MNDTWVLIDSITPDKNQPRKIFDYKHLEGLSQSLKIEGMINPIEVSDDMMIITGECRWKAAKILHWDRVPVRINVAQYSEYERLRHQMAENVHQSGTKESIAMNSMDVAKAYARLIKLKTGKDYVADTLSFKDVYGHIKEIAEEIGVTSQTIGDYLRLLNQPEFIQKDIAEGRPRTYYDAAKYAPPEFRELIQKKIATGEFISRPKINEVVRMARMAPDLARIQLGQKHDTEAIAINRLLTGISRLALAMEALPLTEINKKEKGIVKSQLEWVIKKIGEYLNNV